MIFNAVFTSCNNKIVFNTIQVFIVDCWDFFMWFHLKGGARVSKQISNQNEGGSWRSFSCRISIDLFFVNNVKQCCLRGKRRDGYILALQSHVLIRPVQLVQPWWVNWLWYLPLLLAQVIPGVRNGNLIQFWKKGRGWEWKRTWASKSCTRCKV